MTIYKPKPSDKKAEKKAESQQTKINVPEDAKPLATRKKAQPPISFVVLPVAQRRQRRGVAVAFTTCFMVLMILVVAVSGVFLFKFIVNKRICSKTAEFRFHEYQKTGSGSVTSRRRVDGKFKEKVELDLESGIYERISVPPILESRRSTVLHDFETNWTAIADHDNHRCFVMPLDRKSTTPPKNFADLLEKYNAGYYLPDAEVVRENYKVQLPPVHDRQRYGIYIAYDCRFYDTYQLVRDTDNRDKRSACEMAGDSYCLGDAGTDQMLCLKISGCV